MKIEERIKDSQNQLNGVGIVLIDAQESLLSGIDKKDDLIDALLLLVQSVKILKLPLIVTEQVPNKLGKTSEIISAHLNSNKTISKSAFSIFGSVDFTNHLKELNINHLILTGIETSICIYLSAIDALKAGYEVTILSDCVGARRTGDERVALTKLESSGCHVIPLESFLYGYLGTAEHPEFRLISKLVRDRVSS
jgi:nicotinamidase-related amidase